MNTNEIEVTNNEGLGIIVVPAQCEYCADLGSVEDESPVELVRLERKGDRFVASGKLKLAHCPNCGAALSQIGDVVPIELKDLTCGCGGTKFRFALKSLKPEKANRPQYWVFELDITCLKCNRVKFTEKLLNFFKIKRIKVGLTGVDLLMR